MSHVGAGPVTVEGDAATVLEVADLAAGSAVAYRTEVGVFGAWLGRVHS